ncbi:MAG: 2-hydroxyacyl-CoA dehydratase family protein [Firmicutes bacterium]|jgi:bcr-type benzoyl-CoA reductase subunit B|nr:2-hydroxyacyl-CoA dehydratase [Dethiobacter sp.]MBS3898386.1 2-hydroxyacyl-CoA dehydratase [Dethiobacter sp.]MCL4462471.1 2-hydroxyacyl-CoA dehydratase family protein [Bacillota bacterium]MCL5993647.1 2-hydroxyacyl-CoA dehydratase family protein [Bacillota bacterium]
MSEMSRATNYLLGLTMLYYTAPKQADRKKNPVAWCSSIAPVEFLRAMDVLPLFPENHGALIGARKMGVELAEAAEMVGYANDICSYVRVDIGHILTGKSPVDGLARPDFLVCCNNICSTVVKWYENLAHHFQVPLFLLDTPFNHGLQIPEYSLNYVEAQLREFIPWLEDVTGKKFDEQRFKEVAMVSKQTSSLWRDVLELAKHKPAPFTAFDTFNYMSPIVTMRGTPEALEYYRLLKEELLQKVAAGEAAVTGEKYRLLWNGIPVWFAMRPMLQLFAKYKANLVCSTYTNAWVLDFDPDNLLRSMAEAYTAILINQSLDLKFGNLEKLLQEFELDGIIHHSNRSCKPYCFGLYDLSRRLQAGSQSIPEMIFDGDQTDPRHFSWAQFETRFQSFIETLTLSEPPNENRR